jgi:rifampicin phosphotransferase
MLQARPNERVLDGSRTAAAGPDEPILNWPQAAAAGPAICGGKGWNLGRLDRFGFPVPRGGVLIAEVYTQLMADPALVRARKALARVTAEDVLEPAVDHELAALRRAIEATALPDGVQSRIRSFLADSGLADVPLAVRSSATAEDGRLHSFAGAHSSFPGITGAEAVSVAIRRCYASLWTPRAVAYRRRLGLPDDQVACAVALCAMVEHPDGRPTASGVAFSCDPRIGRRDRVVVSAARGRGAAVGGGGRPEEIAVAIGPSRAAVVARSGPAGPILTDDQAGALARLALRVQWALGEGQDPQDLEWAHDGRQFRLLQARPATRVPRPTYPALAQRPVIWSNANLKDSLPGVVSTLGWSLIRGALWPLLFSTIEAVGSPPPEGMEPARRFSGRAYFDLSSLQWAYYEALGIPPVETNRALGGHQPEITVPPGSPFRGKNGWARLWANLKVVRLLIPFSRTFPRDITRLLAFSRDLKARDLAGRSNAELRESLERTSDVLTAYCARFELTDTGGIWQMLLGDLLDWLKPGRGRALGAGLMAGTGQVTSAEHGYRLAELADLARHDPAARAFLERTPRDPHDWRRLPADSPFRAGFERFLADFGHRGVYEVDLANPRWNEDPSYPLEQVRLLLDAGDVEAARDRGRSVRAEAEAELAACTRWLRPVVHGLANRARRMAALREAGKSALVAPLEPLRAIALEIGRRLTRAGALDEPSDVFHLAREELEAVLRGEWDGAGARALVADRRARAAAWAAEAPPDVIVEDPSGSVSPAGSSGADHPRSRSRRSGRRTRLIGLGVSAGRTEGPACVLHHPAEGRRLRPGDVLIAPSTDPAWTPLFLRASAVVAEVGGYLSHGAIVAREYGLPAVANIPGLLQAVRDGSRLSVDGDTGEVVIQNG